MDPKDFSQYFISLSNLVHDDDLAQIRCPEYVKREPARELARGIEPHLRAACDRHLKLWSGPGPLRNTTETRAEIVIMPAKELRTLLGFVSRLQQEAQAGRCERMTKFLETQP